ncbi:probable ubiquitin-conjugating enzyme E2 23 [Lolium rigidum]|uniref:probable ubiquitin-conjugating enzyme E2 23 n=1 Tax=Lolium rigidum TaxID=89674 RepID=UPI001F5E2F16|nr:probable ubiquitin-conjugating enzyme E2 23 [Lolium rigidum]
MAVAGEEAGLTNRHLYTLDLVGFGRRTLLDRGVVLSLTEDVDEDAYNIICVDGSRVTKKASEILGIFDRTFVHVGQIVGSVSDYGGLSLGDYVVSGQWLGRVADVSLDVEVSFDDGAVMICRVADTGSEDELRPDKPRVVFPETNTGFYPGRRVLTGGDSSDRKEGKVTKVEMADVLVYWIASAAGHGMELAPPANQNPGNLTFFCSAPRCVWSLGDRCFLDTDINNLQNEQRSPAWTPATMTVSLTTSSVEVLWQDGKRQNMAHSAAVYPVVFRSELDFLPGQYVVDNSPDDDNIIYAAAVDGTEEEYAVGTPACRGSKRRVGVVRSLNSKEQIVQVSWFKAGSESSWEVECDDTVSAYDLAMDLEHSVFYGDVVVRLLPDVSGSAPLVQQPVRVKSAPADLSWVGRVVDLHRGHVQVKWGDGSTTMVMMSQVLPHEISIANKMHITQLRAEMGLNNWLEEGVDVSQESNVVNTDNDQNDPADATNVQGNMVQGSDGSMNELDGSVCGNTTETRIGEILDDNSDDVSVDNVVINTTYATREDDPSKWSHFDVVKSPQDHHYLDTIEQGGGGKSWVKAVQTEWKILMNDLPDTIYVRAFEDRMDLLRAVMLGASGTPYQDGLFFFDLQLPLSYPTVPPQAYYHSFGLRLNPNLYESGTVCLSLLGTFGGEGTEVWLPGTSSLLQVLVSIQGLVLNDQPYYNEPAYETFVGTLVGQRNALPYGENAYLLNLRTMLYLLRRPPQGFEEFVKDHFRRRGRFVLKTCEACLQGCAIGTLAGDAHVTKADKEQPCSAGLKLALSNLVPRLVAAFSNIGAEGCDDFQLREPREHVMLGWISMF